MNNLKLFFHYFVEKPAALLCLIALWGACQFYSDNQTFIQEQQAVLREISSTLVKVQTELTALNVRVQNLEAKGK